ncbi:MAG: Rpn family recombination-promoting nuclease/putative transposase, partial [Lachnospiraceae bacterium]|nr:Rpn family recombination-promoting nuclease/putative transposase [Lachnospiraceae bacterium]
MSKTFDELTIADDFMFSKVMLNERLAKHFLEVILGCRIHSVTYPKYEHYINVRYDAKSIRLDVILEDDNHTVYNLEMQTAKLTGLVKRSRYYQDLIDLDLLQKGAKYDELNHSIVIFICTFDLFGKNQWIYRFYNVCQQLLELKLQDGTEKVFVNTMGELGNVDEEFKQVMQIFNGLQAEGDFAEELQQEVERVKLSEEWRREYMTLQ